MDFRELRYVLKVAEYGNITQAAKALFITQPALSHYISKVETRLGMQLFNRNVVPLSLTLAGEKYVKAARKILAIEANLHEELEDIMMLKEGRIVMGIPPARASYVLPYLLRRFHQRYPGIELVTMEKNSGILKQAVLHGKADFAFLPWLSDEEGLEGEVLYMEELFLVARQGMLAEKNFKDKRRSIVDFETLVDEPFVLLRRNRGIRWMVDGIFRQYGTVPQVVMETSSNESAYRLAASGLGLAIVPGMTLYTTRREAQVAVYHLSEKGMRWPLAFVHRKGEYLNVLKLELSDLLQELFERHPPIKELVDGVEYR